MRILNAIRADASRGDIADALGLPRAYFHHIIMARRGFTQRWIREKRLADILKEFCPDGWTKENEDLFVRLSADLPETKKASKPKPPRLVPPRQFLRNVCVAKKPPSQGFEEGCWSAQAGKLINEIRLHYLEAWDYFARRACSHVSLRNVQTWVDLSSKPSPASENFFRDARDAMLIIAKECRLNEDGSDPQSSRLAEQISKLLKSYPLRRNCYRRSAFSTTIER